MKPELQTLAYYDWQDSWDYIVEKYGVNDEDGEVWNHLVDSQEIHNGKPFTISNWELVFEEGKFVYILPDFWIPVLKMLIEEFGEIDKQCLTKGTKTATFICGW